MQSSTRPNHRERGDNLLADTNSSPPTQRATVTDQAGNVRTSQSDALGRMQRVVEANSYITDHTYDARGSLVSVLQGNLVSGVSAPAAEPTTVRRW